jgi:hypothetical protein
MRITKEQVKLAARDAAGHARVAGKRAVARLVEAADVALVEAGRQAKARQRRRTAKRVLKAAGQTALAAGVAAVAVVATRAAVRRARAAGPER